MAALMAGVVGPDSRVRAAEHPEESWTNLNLLKADQKIQVVRTNLKSIEGTFSACSDEAISVRVKGDLISVPRAEVFRVTLQERSKRLRNMLIGMAIGGGAALAIGAAVDKSFSEDDEHIAKTIFIPIGLGAGAGIGASIAGFETVYRGKLQARGVSSGAGPGGSAGRTSHAPGPRPQHRHARAAGSQPVVDGPSWHSGGKVQMSDYRRDHEQPAGVCPPDGDSHLRTMRFDCVFYYVSDLDRAVQFYTTTLGFRLSSRDAVARFHVDGVLFELVPTGDRAVLSGRGNARLTLAVDNIEAAAAELRAKGVALSEVQEVSNGRLVSLADPDGNEIILWQYA